MRSLLLWGGLLIFLGSGNIPLAIILLLIAFCIPPKRSETLKQRSDGDTPRIPKFLGAATAKSRDITDFHREFTVDVSHSKRFSQILNSNLHFLAPLEERDAKVLMQTVADLVIAGSAEHSLAGNIRELYPEATEEDIDRLSETAIRRVQSALAQTRAERMECQWYIWRTCQDDRVRLSHAWMEGIVCSFLDPPRPEAFAGEPDTGAYNPGESPECRCYAEVILDPGFETWPKLAIVDGKLVNIGLREFKLLVNIKANIR